MHNSLLGPIQVSVVCRANEVRSRIIEGLLLNRYPQFQIQSFGVDVTPGSKISSNLTREMKHWGIEIKQSPPNSILAGNEFIKASNLVISADGGIAVALSGEGIPSVNICDFAIDTLHVPEDPVNFKSDRYFANAAKVVHCTAKMIDQVIEKQSQQDAIFVNITSEKDFPDFSRSDSIIVDARLRHGSNEILALGEVRFFEEQELLDGSLIASLQNGIKIYAPKFEFRKPEKALVSIEWSNFVKAVSNFGPVDVVTTPLTANGRHLCDPYLASLIAEKVNYL